MAPGSVYELFVATIDPLLPTSTMLGAVLSIMTPEPCLSVNVYTVVRLSSFFAFIVNARLFVSATVDSTS